MKHEYLFTRARKIGVGGGGGGWGRGVENAQLTLISFCLLLAQSILL